MPAYHGKSTFNYTKLTKISMIVHEYVTILLNFPQSMHISQLNEHILLHSKHILPHITKIPCRHTNLYDILQIYSFSHILPLF